jgi:SAM-dependent methyltransferase
VFKQGDACALPPAAALGGRFTVIHGANLLCRLPDPLAFLSAVPSLLVPGGLLVLVSPYSWLPAYTPRDKWLGGLRRYAVRDPWLCGWSGRHAR